MKKSILISVFSVVLLATAILFATQSKSDASIVPTPQKDFKIAFKDNKNQVKEDAKTFFAKQKEHTKVNNAKVISQKKVTNRELNETIPAVSNMFPEFGENRAFFVKEYTVENYDSPRVTAKKVLITEVWDAELNQMVGNNVKIVEDGEIHKPEQE